MSEVVDVGGCVEQARFDIRAPEWRVPSAAVGAWLLLTAALERVSEPTPCAVDPESWFAGGQSKRLEVAVAGCGVCPVVRLCGEYAELAREVEGVWGGLTAAERARSRRGGVA